jgi:hypothetical protein
MEILMWPNTRRDVEVRVFRKVLGRLGIEDRYEIRVKVKSSFDLVIVRDRNSGKAMTYNANFDLHDEKHWAIRSIEAIASGTFGKPTLTREQRVRMYNHPRSIALRVASI